MTNFQFFIGWQAEKGEEHWWFGSKRSKTRTGIHKIAFGFVGQTEEEIR